ncbi:winged helix-turn-helix transcriptional regulator [Aestuariibius sp. HNIBRBA575]|uniref:winged helix-turn-helix transcriptional regulator n=1 Tax=Aestuariibius sp. HNIBRBA575 TaxID=3233343 RepID=UPI0034A1B58B
MPIDANNHLCPMDPLLRLISSRWTSYIVWQLQNHPGIRFGALQNQVPGISAKMLTERLRELENAGLVTRHIEPTRPPQVSYELTEQARALRGALDALHKVAEDWKQQGWSADTGFPQKATLPS